MIDASSDQASPKSWRPVTRFLRSPLDAAVDALSCALLPADCAVCHLPLLHLSSAPVCRDCWSRLEPQDYELCTRCGESLGIAQFTPSPSESASLDLCRPCELVPPAFARAVAFGAYEGPLRSLIHLFKYDRMEPLARNLAALLAPQIGDLCADTASAEIFVIPVPLHASKLKERGFNQAELLARAVIRQADSASRLGSCLVLATGLLQRMRATGSQAMLTTAQRRRNLRGAFFCSPAAKARFAGKEVLLIDDIYTTGATARACSQVLKQAGAASVRVATVARAQREGSIRWDAGHIAATTPSAFTFFER